MDLIKQIPHSENREKVMDRVGLVVSAVEEIEAQMLKALVRKRINQKLKAGNYGNLMLQQVYNECDGFDKKATKSKKGTARKMVTISFDDSKFKPEEFNDTMVRMLKFKYMKDSIYALEQRSDTREWYGYHLHFITPDNSRKPSELIRDSKRVFGHWITGDNYIQVDTMYSDNCLNYFIEKKDESKKVKQIQDRLMREKYSILDSSAPKSGD